MTGSELYRQRDTLFAQSMADQKDWESLTEHSRHLAIVADAEVRRRRPDRPMAPMRSAELALVSDTRRERRALARSERSARMQI